MPRTLPLLLFGIFVPIACSPEADLRADAAVAVVRDLVPLAPEGYTRHLSDQWQIGWSDSAGSIVPMLEPIPSDVLKRLRAASGLRTASREVVASRDSSIIILSLFRPQVVRTDSIEVTSLWHGLTHGDGGGAWAVEYFHLLSCVPECRIEVQQEAGHWN
jgi:hypothetical protein